MASSNVRHVADFHGLQARRRAVAADVTAGPEKDVPNTLAAIVVHGRRDRRQLALRLFVTSLRKDRVRASRRRRFPSG